MAKTIDQIKQKRTVSSELKEKSKKYVQMKKAIKKALETGEKTIPEIASETGINQEDVTYYLMTMRKFHEVVEGEIDDMDEYFYYKLPE